MSINLEKFADFSALIEHTDRVIYLEDDDVTSIVDGSKFLFLIFLLLTSS